MTCPVRGSAPCMTMCKPAFFVTRSKQPSATTILQPPTGALPNCNLTLIKCLSTFASHIQRLPLARFHLCRFVLDDMSSPRVGYLHDDAQAWVRRNRVAMAGTFDVVFSDVFASLEQMPWLLEDEFLQVSKYIACSSSVLLLVNAGMLPVCIFFMLSCSAAVCAENISQ